MFQAQGSNVKYGSNICASYLNSLGDYVLITHKEPWDLIGKEISVQPKLIVEAKELSKKYLDELANDVPGMHIVGLYKRYILEDLKFIFPPKCPSFDDILLNPNIEDVIRHVVSNYTSKFDKLIITSN